MKVFRKIKGNRLIIDSFWAILGNVVSKGLALVGSIFIARFLGKDIFGEYGFIKTTLISLAMFSTFGLGYSITKFVAEHKNENNDTSLLIRQGGIIVFVISCLIASLCFIFSRTLSHLMVDNLSLDISLKILSILIVLSAFNTYLTGVIAGLGRFAQLAKVNYLTGIFTFLITISLVYFLSYKGALIALVIGEIINLALNFKVSEVNFNSLLNFKNVSLNELKPLLLFTFPVAIQEGVYAGLQWANNVFLVKFSSIGELGQLSAALQWNAIILFIPGILRNVILSHLSGSSSSYQFSSILKQTMVINFISTFTPALLIAIFSNFIASFYGESFNNLSLLLTLSVFTTIFISLSNVYAQVYMSKGLNWTMLLFRIIRDGGATCLFLAFSYYGFFYGAKAMVSATFIMSFLFLIIMAIYYHIYDLKNS